MIPGALEPWVAGRDGAPLTHAVVIVPGGISMVEAADRGRLEHEREGGGAPSARLGRRNTWVARLWRWALNPSDGATVAPTPRGGPGVSALDIDGPPEQRAGVVRELPTIPVPRVSRIL